jgi:hypothetical protein
MWPAEGSVGESIVGHFRNHGVCWIATDKGVLKRSGDWGYDADKPDSKTKKLWPKLVRRPLKPCTQPKEGIGSGGMAMTRAVTLNRTSTIYFDTILRCSYMLAALDPPLELDYDIVPHVVTWSFLDQKNSISPRDLLRFKAGCPGLLVWSVNDWEDVRETVLGASGGVMAGYTATLGPFDEAVRSVEFLFKCQCKPVCDCAPEDLCCDGRRYTVLIEGTPKKTA